MRCGDEVQTVVALSQHLEKNAAHYFPDFDSGHVEVLLLSERRRTNSAIYRFQLSGNAMCRVVLVKVPSLRGGALRDERPYFIPETDPSIKYRVQYAAMVALHARFSGLSDARFGSIRPLDLLPDHAAFVMEEVAGQTLKRLLPGSSRLLSPFRIGKIRDVFDHTGAWLRAFHEMPVETNLPVVRPGCTEYIDLMGELTSFLGQGLDDKLFFRSVAERTLVVARGVLSESLRLGVRFGDFGLTNVLVANDSRITGIDTLAIWRAPIYEDIGYFLTGLKTYSGQVLSLGLGFGSDRMAELEAAFLRGYFQSQPIPLSEIRLYEILRLLERWSAKIVRMRRRGLGAQIGAPLLNRFMRKTVSSLLEETCRR